MTEKDSEDRNPRVETGSPRRIVKLGGSLLTFEFLGSAFQQWLASQPSSLNLVIVGGGEQVDEIRRDQATSGGSDEDCHKLALEAMGRTSQIAAELLQLSRTSDQDLALDWLRGLHRAGQAGRLTGEPEARAMIFDLSSLALQDLSLPRTWDLTSDSLAAWIAQSWSISELILMKSRPAPIGWTPKSRGFDDWVDPLFPEFSAGLRVDWLNLRALPS